MANEPYYVTYYIAVSVLSLVSLLIIYAMFVLFMDSLENDNSLINEFYYIPPKRRKRRKRRNSF